MLPSGPTLGLSVPYSALAALERLIDRDNACRIQSCLASGLP
jgi:hypothetical protein